MATNVVSTQTATYRDVRGHVAKVKFHISYDSTSPADGYTRAVAICTAIQAIFGSNLVAVKYSGPFAADLDPAAFPTPGAGEKFIQAETKVRLKYITGPAGGAAGTSVHTMDIPAPLAANFNADDETMLNSAITPLTTAFKAVTVGAFMSDALMQPVLHVLGAVLVRRKFQRKETIYSKLPDLSGFQL